MMRWVKRGDEGRIRAHLRLDFLARRLKLSTQLLNERLIIRRSDEALCYGAFRGHCELITTAGAALVVVVVDADCIAAGFLIK